MGSGFIIVGITNYLNSLPLEKQEIRNTSLTIGTPEETKELKNPINEAIKKASLIAKERKIKRTENMWSTVVETSQIDDSKTIRTTANAIQQINKHFGYAKPRIVFSCNKSKMEVYIDWDMFIGLGDKEVTIRIDKNTASSSKWTSSTDGKATYAKFSSNFARKLIGHQKLTLQVTPYNKAPIVTVFDISNFENGISQLREKCKF